MPSNLVKSKKEEKFWVKAKKAVADSKNKSEEDFTDRDWGLVNHIFQSMKEAYPEHKYEYLNPVMAAILSEDEEDAETPLLHVVDMDERGQYSAHIEDEDGEIVFSYGNEDSEDGDVSLITDGYMKNTSDMGGLLKYMKQMDIAPKNAELYAKQRDFDKAVEALAEPMEEAKKKKRLGKKKNYCPGPWNIKCRYPYWMFAPYFGDDKGHSGATIPPNNISGGTANQTPSSPAYPGAGGINMPGVPGGGPNAGMGPIGSSKNSPEANLNEAAKLLKETAAELLG